MENKVIKRKLEGEVTSDKMDKTVSVLVTSVKTHSKYKKQYKSSKKYKAHDENNEYKVGDKVTIQECRPISRDKRWRVIKKVK
ncbi:MAG: 30S ribosomal protein S17 [Candidatus Pacebacteria bacterium]|jgi:small subunit ribosomal protein S17|nr:30S ribosomal protein S17 [Candidatus Paceibacterota bacterium]MBT4652220.1 30S ribosomal protein S17 [Candidatus Paceibacterota bacterium]MBT6755663.1 30S ribosomal protein S17 [Candidatus Paceibacterota bacterium]MBT6920982.1 30S ribosomal protein S17 [Candidatus Paceibacterota bacterium]